MQKIGICAIAKNENNYLREWVLYHKQLHFDKIILYDNNDITGEHFDEVIGDFIQDGFVSVIDVRGRANQQIKCFNDCYQENTYKLDWIAFFDIDEFMVLNTSENIHEFIDNPRYKDFNCITINWKLYDDNGLIEVKNNNYNVFKRFTNPVETSDNHTVKRIIKTGLGCRVNSAHGAIDRSTDKKPWTSYGHDKNEMLVVCDGNGKKLTHNKISIPYNAYDHIWLNHYRYKTIAEYISNKKARGYATIYQNNGKDMSIKQFFNINKYTIEKINKIAELLHISVDRAKELAGWPEEKRKATPSVYLYF